MNINKKSYHYFLIWAHGIQYTDDILDVIASHGDMDIKIIKHHKVDNIRDLVDIVYSHDYAPIEHLTNKTKYLGRLQAGAIIIIVECNNCMDDYRGDGSFRHLENMQMVELKNDIRQKYNPRQNGAFTHEHVIHVSGNEKQTDYILKYIGYLEGVKKFLHRSDIINIPWHFLEESYDKIIYDTSISNISYL